MHPLSSVKPTLNLHVGVKLSLTLSGAWASIALLLPETLGLVLVLSVLYAGLLIRWSTLIQTYLVISITALIYLSFSYLMAPIPNYGFMFQGSVSTLLIPFYRLTITTSTSLALAFSTDMGELLRELNRLHLPNFLSIPLSVAVRFLPIFWDDVAIIRDVNRLRFNGKSFFRQLLSPIRFWRTFCVPLIFRALHSADSLALSATLKGVGKKGGLATLPKVKMGTWDVITLVIWIGVLGIALYWQGILITSSRERMYVH